MHHYVGTYRECPVEVASIVETVDLERETLTKECHRLSFDPQNTK